MRKLIPFVAGFVVILAACGEGAGTPVVDSVFTSEPQSATTTSNDPGLAETPLVVHATVISPRETTVWFEAPCWDSDRQTTTTAGEGEGGASGYESIVTADESSGSVTIAVASQHDSDCVDVSVIELRSPLGSRPLIDGATGLPIPVSYRDSAVVGARVSSDGQTLTLMLSLCGATVALDERINRVGLAAMVGAGNERRYECSESHTFALKEPLGDRVLVEYEVLETIPVER